MERGISRTFDDGLYLKNINKKMKKRGKKMKKHVKSGIVLMIAALLLCTMAPAMAAAPESIPSADGLVASEVAEIQFTVVSVGVVEPPADPAMMDGATGMARSTREVVLEDKDGNKKTITLGKEVKNFDQIKKGDIVTIAMKSQVAVFVGKMGLVPGSGQSKMIFSAPKGMKPGALEVEKQFVTLTITKLDADNKEVTVRMPDNSIKKVNTPNLNFAAVKVGDDVVVGIMNETSIQVTAPK